MRARAPGKLVLTGAYAVLTGAPAIVVAVDRHAVADASRACPSPSPEVRAAFGDDPAPVVDVRALCDASGKKLGLGSSAAAVVASLAARALARGVDLARADVREALFHDARRAHAEAQGGGSGVDVAASVHGGVLRYTLGGGAGGDPSIRAVALPAGLVLTAYFSGVSARTSDLLARVGALRAARPGALDAIERAMTSVAHAAAAAVGALEGDGDRAALIDAARSYGGLLGELGSAADAPIVPPSCAELAALARGEGAAFLPSGAGGGDVAVWLGPAPASAAFDRRARELGLVALALGVDPAGVRAAAGSADATEADVRS